MAKYKKEIDSLFREMIFEDWMDEEDWQWVLKETMRSIGTTYEEMAEQIDRGIANGLSLDSQLLMCKMYLSKAK